jgi:hypothetical protein
MTEVGYTLMRVHETGREYFFTGFDGIGGIQGTNDLNKATLYSNIPALVWDLREQDRQHATTAKDWTIVRVYHEMRQVATSYVEV